MRAPPPPTSHQFLVTSCYIKQYGSYGSLGNLGNINYLLQYIVNIWGLSTKQETGQFTVQLQDVFETHKNIMKFKISMDEGNEKISKLCAAYNKFLSHCNAVDFADVLQRVKTTFIVDSSVKDNFQTSHQFVVVGTPNTQLEVSKRIEYNFNLYLLTLCLLTC